MPKTYAPDRKREALDLLALHDRVSTVQRLTGIPYSTLYRWRSEEFSKESRLSEEKDFMFSDKFSQKSAPASDPDPPASAEEASADHPDESPAPGPSTASSPSRWKPPDESHWGVPGKTYPYPIEDEEDAERFEELAALRDLLLDHALALAADLKPTDPDINLRSLALGRMLDQVQQLDAVLPDLNPNRVVRFEFLYEGSVHKVPPWKGIIPNQDAFRKWMSQYILENAIG